MGGALCRDRRLGERRRRARRRRGCLDYLLNGRRLLDRRRVLSSLARRGGQRRSGRERRLGDRCRCGEAEGEEGRGEEEASAPAEAQGSLELILGRSEPVITMNVDWSFIIALLNLVRMRWHGPGSDSNCSSFDKAK